MRYAMRISLHDRPGQLGKVARALGDGGFNILTLDVVARESTDAVDDVVIDGPPDAIDDLRRTVESIPGALVEACRPLPHGSRSRTPLRLAAAVVAAPAEQVLATLVAGLPGAMAASWALVVRERSPQPEVLVASKGTPSFVNVGTPWFPLLGPRRLESAMWMPLAWRTGHHLPSIIAAPLGDPRTAVLVGRPFGPRFREPELTQLTDLARIAQALDDRTPAPSLG